MHNIDKINFFQSQLHLLAITTIISVLFMILELDVRLSLDTILLKLIRKALNNVLAVSNKT